MRCCNCNKMMNSSTPKVKTVNGMCCLKCLAIERKQEDDNI